MTPGIAGYPAGGCRPVCRVVPRYGATADGGSSSEEHRLTHKYVNQEWLRYPAIWGDPAARALIL
jgi:hypothetical protein